MMPGGAMTWRRQLALFLIIVAGLAFVFFILPPGFWQGP